MTTARREPAASSTARKSSTRCCTVGMPATGSDSPVPGLSNSRRRPIDANRRKNAVAYGSAHNRSRCETRPAPRMMSMFRRGACYPRGRSVIIGGRSSSDTEEARAV